MKRPSRLLAVCLLGVFLAFLAAAGVAQAQSSTRSSGLIVHQGQSIQAAVDRAKPGSSIIVSGVHRENVVIRKNGITLIGHHTVLKPPVKPNSFCGPSGFCIAGNVDFNTGKVHSYVEDVRIIGFTVRGFKEDGIVTFGAKNALFMHNHATSNGAYGIFALASTGTRVVSNVTSGAGEAGIYIGDSPHANATVVGNNSYNNLFGIFVRHATHGRIVGNNTHNNCVGTLFLADAPGPAGSFKMVGNQVLNNTKACKAGEDAPPVSGVGVAIVGAHDVSLTGNTITGNRPSGPSAFKGGVVLVRGSGGTAPKDNSVIGNTILHNSPDVFWDKSGSGNRFVGNHCNTSKPGGLCAR